VVDAVVVYGGLEEVAVFFEPVVGMLECVVYEWDDGMESLVCSPFRQI